MIPARIISIDDKVMVEYEKPYSDLHRRFSTRSIRTIAEVENAIKSIHPVIHSEYSYSLREYFYVLYNKHSYVLELNQQVFIEPTDNNKVKIVKI